VNQTEAAGAVPPGAAPLAILHVDPERGWGGGQELLLELTRHLADRSHQQVVACRPDGPLHPVLEARGIPVCDLRIRNDLDILAAWRLRRLLRAHPVDIVHFHTARAHALAPWLPRAGGCRFVVSRQMDYRPHFAPRARYLYNRCVDGVIAVSHAIADVLVGVGVDPRHIRVIHVGIDGSRFEQALEQRQEVRRRLGAEPGDFVLLTAAVLEARKGHDVLLQAVEQLWRDRVPLRWVICGEGALRERLQTQTRAAGLAERVVFTGFSSEVPRLLAAADAFVLPSRHEGLGMAAIEAMAAGLPVVASRVGGLPEVVVDGETGLLVPVGDASALAAAIRRCAHDRGWAQALGHAGRARARALFSGRAMAAAVESYYYELLGLPAGGGRL
jgi:glycosyltransferase involved in cell wall biosynthesis